MSNQWDEYFNDAKYKVKISEVIIKGGITVYRFFCRELDVSDMLFTKRDDGSYDS